MFCYVQIKASVTFTIQIQLKLIAAQSVTGVFIFIIQILIDSSK